MICFYYINTIQDICCSINLWHRVAKWGAPGIPCHHSMLFVVQDIYIDLIHHLANESIKIDLYNAVLPMKWNLCDISQSSD